MKSLFHLFSPSENAIPQPDPVQVLIEAPPAEVPTLPTPEIFPKDCPSPTTIKHIVISGGSEMGFAFYTILRDSNKSGFWKYENIESVYGTSIGTLFAMMIILIPHFDWDIFDDFIVKRPWHNVFDIKLNTMIQSINQKGILGIKTVEEIIFPVFSAADIPMNITMAEFFKFTGVEFHLITAEITGIELIDICHTTHPDWKLVDALYCSMCLPILFIPHTVDNKMYIDGGLLCNYPLNQCLANGANPDEIFGINVSYINEGESTKIDTLIEYLLFIILCLLMKVIMIPSRIKNQVDVDNDNTIMSIYNIYKSTSDLAYRTQLMEKGAAAWREFYAKTYLTEDADLVETVNP